MNKRLLKLPNILLIRTGITSLDIQCRVWGCLDIPLAPEGESQMDQTAGHLASRGVYAVVSAPGLASRQSAKLLAEAWKSKKRVEDGLQNIDFGLWHGKSINELRETQPRILKCLEERPEMVCPPNGEPVLDFRVRILATLESLGSRYGNRQIAIVAPGPVSAVIRAIYLGHSSFDENGTAIWWDSTTLSVWHEFSGRESALAT